MKEKERGGGSLTGTTGAGYNICGICLCCRCEFREVHGKRVCFCVCGKQT